MKKTRKTMLRSSFIMLLVATLSLSSATFAWFTAGKTASVEQIEFTATATSGLQISADAVNFKGTLLKTDITTAQTDALKGNLAPLSSAGEFNDSTKALNLYSGTVSNTYLVTSDATAQSTESVASFWTFDLYFKNTGNTAQKVYLDFATDNKSAVTDSSADGKDKDLSNAIRVAFVDRGDSNDLSTVKTLTGTDVKIWEPNADTHGGYATTYRYKVNANGSTDGNTKVAADTAYPYVAIKAADATGLTITHEAASLVTDKSVVMNNYDSTNYPTSVLYQTAAANTDPIKIAEIPGNYVCKMTVYVWIEGQDVDCNNQESGGTVNLDLHFKSEEVTA